MKKEPTTLDNQSLHHQSIAESQTVQTVIGYLRVSASQLDQQTVGQLDHARENALSALAARKQSASASHGTQVLSLLGHYIGHHRSAMSAVLILGAVLIALFVSQQFSAQNDTEQGDAFLLASDLPPDAYLDKGFDVWLKHN